jgi:magnesium transporter
MMNFHSMRQGRLARLAHESETLPVPSDLRWIDLYDPTHEEEKRA